MRRVLVFPLVGLLVLLASAPSAAQDVPEFTRTRDVIYGRKFGLALTMDVFVPKKGANGLAVVAVVSGGWFSRPEMIAPPFYHELLRRGYTVFAVVHGSQPRFTIDSANQDISRAVRFIRYHAKKHRIDPERIGITGLSAGGHLSLMQGTAGDKGNPKAKDLVDRMPSGVQAVACFFPPTDFLNFGGKGKELLRLQPPFTAAADYHLFDEKQAKFERVTDKEKLREIARRMSPASHVSKNSAPVLILHGDKDKLVPIQQAEWILARYKAVGVPASLIVRKDEGHGWLSMVDDMTHVADWFDKHLAKAKKKGD